MKTIKFRGVRLSDGQTIYGDFHRQKGAAYIDEWRVDPYRVDQFAGCDENGDEVFENDTVISHGKEYKVKIDFCYGVFHDIKRARKK